ASWTGELYELRPGRSPLMAGQCSETKELVAGFWLFQVKSLAEAIEWVKRCPDPFEDQESEIEIRQVFEASDFGAEFTPELQEQEARIRSQIDKAKGGK